MNKQTLRHAPFMFTLHAHLSLSLPQLLYVVYLALPTCIFNAHWVTRGLLFTEECLWLKFPRWCCYFCTVILLLFIIHVKRNSPVASVPPIINVYTYIQYTHIFLKDECRIWKWRRNIFNLLIIPCLFKWILAHLGHQKNVDQLFIMSDFFALVYN